MLTIRLNRTGKKNAPSYRVVLIKKTASPKSGKFLEVLGNYNPRLKEVKLNKERIEYWIGRGVKTSDTVHNLLVSNGIVDSSKIKKRFKTKKKEAEEKTEEKTEEKVEKEIDKIEKKEQNIDRVAVKIK